MACLLAVDVGLRTGLALYGDDGRLRWYRSHNFGSKARLKRAAFRLFREHPDLAWLVMEGGGDVADAWRREAERRGVGVIQMAAQDWRAQLLYDREQRSGAAAKEHAGALARRTIEWSDAPKATSLRHDAAEAILAGLVGCIEVGWLNDVPETLKR